MELRTTLESLLQMQLVIQFTPQAQQQSHRSQFQLRQLEYLQLRVHDRLLTHLHLVQTMVHRLQITNIRSMEQRTAHFHQHLLFHL